MKDVEALPDLMEVLRIPLFRSSSDLRVTWLPYQVCAAALHFGPTVHRGHYRALLRSGEKIYGSRGTIRVQSLCKSRNLRS